MIDDHNLKLEQNNAKSVRKRGRPRTRPCADTINQSDGNADSSGTRENKRQCRPPKNLEEDYDYGVKRKIRRESITDKIFRCTRSGCGHRFSSEANLHYHYTCHSENVKSFVCRECHDEFHHWRGLAMHLWKEHTIDVDLHSCTECSYKTYSYFKLDNHRKIHSDERAFVCPTCHKGFKQISQLRNHLVIHLDRKNLPEKRWYSEQQCDTCGRKFSDAKCLRKHQQAVHSKLKPYICSYCGHLSARKAMLELHMRQHTGEKPFLCEHCDYRTGDHNSLRRHRMRHTGAKPYKCPHCPYACIQAISYKTHLRNKHPGMEGLFSCTICTFKSVSKENYVNHMSDHKRQAETLVESSTNITSDSEIPLDSLSAPDQSPIQMQLSDNTIQQLEGILDLNAAQLVCSCLNALSQDGGTLNLPPGVTVNIPPFSSSADGTQTITIQLPTGNENENEPYYLAIQQQDGTTALVLPSSTEQNDGSVPENAELENVHFVEQDVTASSSLDCGVLQGDNEGSQLHSGNSDSLVIAHIEEPFDDPESFSTEVMTTSEDNQN
ncbi:Zinc finger protein 569, partial [Stegodyphus mimosarum]